MRRIAATAAALGFLKDVARPAMKYAFALMNFLALVGVLVTISYAHAQLQEARRVAAVTSLLALKSDVTESRRRVYDLFTKGAAIQEDEKDKLTALVQEFRLNVLDHLLTIEYSCSLYLNDVLGKEARRFLEAVITEDLKFLGGTYELVSFYKNGELVLGEYDSVPWVDPKNPEAQTRYPNTLQCAKRLGVSLG